MSAAVTAREAAALLARQDNILILTHRRPDGDTIGCAAGLCAALRQLGKTAWLLYNPDITASNQIYAAPFWAPEDFQPEYVVSVDIAARSLFFPGGEAYFDRIGLAVWTPPGRPAGRLCTRSAGSWGRLRRRWHCPCTPP